MVDGVLVEGRWLVGELVFYNHWLLVLTHSFKISKLCKLVLLRSSSFFLLVELDEHGDVATRVGGS